MSLHFKSSFKRPRQIEHRAIIALDLDCFYASVAIRERPHLRDKPVVIVQKHLCVTSNYVARTRAKGAVQKMTPVSVAKRACPDLILIDGSDLSPFRAASLEVLTVIRNWLSLQAQNFPSKFLTCPCQRLGFDEVFVDITELVDSRIENGQQPWHFDGHIFGDTDDDDQRRFLMVASQVANELRQHVIEKTKLTLCAGISINKLLAKLAVNMHKPDDQTTFLPKHRADHIATLSPRNIPGFGYGISMKIEAYLQKTNHHIKELQTVSDFLKLFGDGKSGERTLTKILGHEPTAVKLLNLFLGIDPSGVKDTGNAPKSIQSEDSFRGCTTMEDLKVRVKMEVKNLVTRLYDDGQMYCRRPRTFSVGYRYRHVKWSRSTHSMSMPVEVASLSCSTCTNEAKDKVQIILEKLVLKVLKEHAGANVGKQFNFTLIAVAASNFIDNPNSRKEFSPSTQAINSLSKPDAQFQFGSSSRPIAKKSRAEHSSFKKIQNVELGSSKNMKPATCPICNRELSLDNDMVNKHIDHCVGIEEKEPKRKKQRTSSQTLRVDSFFPKLRR